MRRLADLDPETLASADVAELAALGEGRRGFSGVIASVRARDAVAAGGLPAAELERRLLEMGFVEGARVEILHEGLFGGDPIAVRVDDMRVAVRRRDARSVLVKRDAALTSTPERR